MGAERGGRMDVGRGACGKVWETWEAVVRARILDAGGDVGGEGQNSNRG